MTLEGVTDLQIARNQLLSARGPQAQVLIIIGGGPFQICNAHQSHVITIIIRNCKFDNKASYNCRILLIFF